MENLEIPEIIDTPELSPTQLMPIDVLENSSVTSAVSSKRRRLTFSNSDPSRGTPDKLC